jgi:amino-acid N-acetyltransferase
VENRRLSPPPSLPALRPCPPSSISPLSPGSASVAPYIHKFRHQTFVVGLCGRGHRRGQAQHLGAGPGHDPEHGRQDRAGARLSPPGQRTAGAKGHAARYSHGMRITDEWRWTAPRRPPASCATRSRPRFQPGPAQHADGHSTVRGVGQLPHRAAGGHRRRRGLPAFGLVRKVDVAGIRRARWTSARWCCCRRSASRPPARPST